MRILGIDPGYGITGFGVIEGNLGQYRLLKCGAITTPPGADFSARLEMIYEDMRQLLAVTKPDAVAIEELFFGHNVTTGIGVAQSRGVILLAVRQAGVEVGMQDPYHFSKQFKNIVGISPSAFMKQAAKPDATIRKNVKK